MILPDVNVLIYAHREDAEGHARYRSWLESVLRGEEPFGISDVVLSGFLRVATHPRIFNPPTPPATAIEFVKLIRNQPHAVPVMPGPRHWEIFLRLCNEPGVKGNLVADAYLAALAIESGSEWVTTDADYSRFAGLKWHRPF